MLRFTTKILILFLVSGVLSTPVDDIKEVKEVKEVKENPTPVFKENVASADEGISIPVQVVHEFGRSIENNDVNNIKTTNREEALVQKLNLKCSQSDVSSCVMLKLVTYMNRLLKKANIEVYDGLEITQTTEVVEEVKVDAARANDNEETVFTQLVTDKLYDFARSRSLRWNILGDADLVFSTTADDKGALKLGVDVRASKSLEQGRGKNKNMGPLIAMVLMKVGMVGALAFKGLALLVGKALLVSKIALLLAGIIGLSKLFHQEKHVTYEVVAHPHHSSSHGHSSVVEGHGHGGGDSSGWGRSAQDMAYSAHVPTQ